MSVGEQIRTARTGQGLTQIELAKKAGVSLRTIARLELGVPISIATLDRVAEALGLMVELNGQAVRGRISGRIDT